MDEVVIVNFVNALMANDSVKANFYMERVKPDLGAVLRSWLQKDPLHNKTAPPHPGVTEDYKQVLSNKFTKIDSLRTDGNIR